MDNSNDLFLLDQFLCDEENTFGAIFYTIIKHSKQSASCFWFPYRIEHKRFLLSNLSISWSTRYNILAAAVVANAKNDKSAAKSLFEIVGLEAEKYRLGHTKASNNSFPL